MAAEAESELSEEESTERCCRQCGRTLLDSERSLCLACNEEKHEPFGRMAARALVVGGVLAGGVYVVAKGTKRLLRKVGVLSPRKTR